MAWCCDFKHAGRALPPEASAEDATPHHGSPLPCGKKGFGSAPRLHRKRRPTFSPRAPPALPSCPPTVGSAAAPPRLPGHHRARQAAVWLLWEVLAWPGCQIQPRRLSAFPGKEGMIPVRSPRFRAFIFLLRVKAEAKPYVTGQMCSCKNNSSCENAMERGGQKPR